MKSGFVSLIGRPNAGKSTLLNRLVGRKLAIVSDKPQTTRTRILAVRNYPEGQVVLLDTPGIHKPLHRLNVRMVDTALDTMREVDVLGVVIDASEKPGSGDRFLLGLLRHVKAPVILILNKVDLIAKPRLLPMIAGYQAAREFAEIVPVSALTGDNVDRLEKVFLDYLPEGQPLYPSDYVTDQPERFMVAEIVREKLLQHTHAELPFSTAVVVDHVDEAALSPRRARSRETGASGRGAPRALKEDEKGLLRLYCSILVDRESQKPIVVERGGEMIKRIGTEARQELERFFQTRVFLDLHVKVKSQWREDDRVLDEMGLRRPGS
jgi:GTP-binding protein Era